MTAAREGRTSRTATSLSASHAAPTAATPARSTRPASTRTSVPAWCRSARRSARTSQASGSAAARASSGTPGSTRAEPSARRCTQAESRASWASIPRAVARGRIPALVGTAPRRTPAAVSPPIGSASTARARRPGWTPDHAIVRATVVVVTPGEPLALSRLIVAISAPGRLDDQGDMAVGRGHGQPRPCRGGRRHVDDRDPVDVGRTDAHDGRSGRRRGSRSPRRRAPRPRSRQPGSDPLHATRRQASARPERRSEPGPDRAPAHHPARPCPR